MKNHIALAALLASAAAAAATAEFFPGQPVGIVGTASASSNPNIQDTTWGTGQSDGQGSHQLGGQSQYWDSVYGPTLPVFVTSTVNSPFSVTFIIDFTQFVASDYSHYTIDIYGLKSDATIQGATGNFGTFTTDGNSLHWEGSGADVAAIGVLGFKVFQAPAPGAIAVLGLAGLAAGARRRRA